MIKTDPFATATHRNRAVNVAGSGQTLPGEISCLLKYELAVKIQVPIPERFPDLAIGLR
jgi:hypothetical protein